MVTVLMIIIITKIISVMTVIKSDFGGKITYGYYLLHKNRKDIIQITKLKFKTVFLTVLVKSDISLNTVQH